ncbi:MAG: peptidylprolyl isomerase [Chthoniobacterales bacterium]
MKLNKPISLLAITFTLSFAFASIQAQSTGSAPSMPPPAKGKAMTASKMPTAGATSTVIALKDPIAIVDGENISKEQLEKAFREALMSSGVNPSTITADQKLQAYRQILDSLIVEQIVNKKSASVQVSDADVAAQIEKIKKQFPSEEVFNAELKKSGKTMDELTANVKKSLHQKGWMESQIKGKDEVTDAEAQKFYNDNIKQFENPDMVKASHILFMVPQGAPDSVVKAKEEAAKAAIIRANKGEDFSKLAAELSEEPGAKQKGGDLGFFDKEHMLPEFSTAAFSQKVGTVSAVPVKTKFGFHVIKVTEKKPAGTIVFAEAKPNIIAYLQNQKRREAFRTIMQQLHQDAKIENFLPAPAPMPMQMKGPMMKPSVTAPAKTATSPVSSAIPSPAPASAAPVAK